MSEQTEIADAYEPDREHVQQKSAKKFMHTQRHSPLLIMVPRVPPAERDLMIFERQ